MPYYTTLQTPIGELTLLGSDDALTGVYMQNHRHADLDLSDRERSERKLRDAVEQLSAYFAGRLRQFDLPLAPRGTDFQLRVWRALRDIPYGRTESYGGLARHIGQPAASRAVGMANGRNPLSIVVPCHRVIGADGSLTGYGGGIRRKRWLLQHEAAQSGESG